MIKWAVWTKCNLHYLQYTTQLWKKLSAAMSVPVCEGTVMQDVSLMLQAGKWNHGTALWSFCPGDTSASGATGTLPLKRHIRVQVAHAQSCYPSVFKWSVKHRAHQYYCYSERGKMSKRKQVNIIKVWEEYTGYYYETKTLKWSQTWQDQISPPQAIAVVFHGRAWIHRNLILVQILCHV